VPGTNTFPNTPDAHWLGISPAGFGPVGALLNFVVAYAVSLATKAPPREVVELVESIRVPRGAGKAVAH
jgi:cation/acetate symporter